MFDSRMPNSTAASQKIVRAAWLHIGPDDTGADQDSAPVGIQRLFVTKPTFPRFVQSHLATNVHSAVWAVTGDSDAAESVRQAVLARRGNVRVSLGGGMYATIFPAEPASGVNLDYSTPSDWE